MSDTSTYDPVRWRCTWTVEKWHDSAAKEAGHAPDEIVPGEGNLLLTSGITLLWTLLTGGAGTAYSTANAAIGVGDSTTATAAAQTDLQAATNKLRKTVKQAPVVGPTPTVSANQVQFVADFLSAEANYVWNEFGVFNSATAGAGTMLNRAVAALGTKAAGTTWTLTVTVSLS